MQRVTVGLVALLVFIAVTSATRYSPIHSVPCIPIFTSFVCTKVQTLCEGCSRSIDVVVVAFSEAFPHESPASILCSAYLPVCICLAGTWYNKWQFVYSRTHMWFRWVPIYLCCSHLCGSFCDYPDIIFIASHVTIVPKSPPVGVGGSSATTKSLFEIHYEGSVKFVDTHSFL